MGAHPLTRRGLEAGNLLVLGDAVLRAALARTESRGAHFRRDYPVRQDEEWQRHSITEPAAGRRPSSPASWLSGSG